MKSLAFLVLIALFVPALAILPAHAAPALAVQVVYLENNNVITTYDVNPTTGKMTPVGHPLTIEAAQYLGPISSLPNGHFIYILWQDANRENHVSVYATNSWGVPNRSPLQTIGSTRLGRFEVDPDGKFAYALMGWIDAKGELNSNIRLFTIDSGSGKLTESKQIQAHYGPTTTTALTSMASTPVAVNFTTITVSASITSPRRFTATTQLIPKPGS